MLRSAPLTYASPICQSLLRVRSGDTAKIIGEWRKGKGLATLWVMWVVVKVIIVVREQTHHT